MKVRAMQAFMVLLGLTGTNGVAAADGSVDDTPQARYAKALMSAVEENWSEPEGVESYDVCKISVRQDRSGYVQEVKILECPSGVVSNSILRAVAAASPLPEPDEPAVFENVVKFAFTLSK